MNSEHYFDLGGIKNNKLKALHNYLHENINGFKILGKLRMVSLPNLFTLYSVCMNYHNLLFL